MRIFLGWEPMSLPLKVQNHWIRETARLDLGRLFLIHYTLIWIIWPGVWGYPMRRVHGVGYLLLQVRWSIESGRRLCVPVKVELPKEHARLKQRPELVHGQAFVEQIPGKSNTHLKVTGATQIHEVFSIFQNKWTKKPPNRNRFIETGKSLVVARGQAGGR